MSNTVAIYLRKSRDEDNETRDVTLARHEKLLNEYCELDPKDKNLLLKSFIDCIEYNKRISKGDFELKIYLKI